MTEADAGFYSVERLLEWTKAGSVVGLIEADQKAYGEILKAEKLLQG